MAPPVSAEKFQGEGTCWGRAGEALTGESVLCLLLIHRAFLPPLTQRGQRRTNGGNPNPGTGVGFMEEDMEGTPGSVKATLALVELVWTEMIGTWSPLASLTASLPRVVVSL